MQITNTSGATVDVPVSLPDCFTFYAYLPTLGGVHEFVCWPSSRDNPANSEPKCIAFSGSDGMLHVSPDDLDAEDRALYDAWVNGGAPQDECPFSFLDHRDAWVVAEAAGDVLWYVCRRLFLHMEERGAERAPWTPEDVSILQAIADLRVTEGHAWDAWRKLPLAYTKSRHAHRQRGVEDPSDDAVMTESRYILGLHVVALVDDAETWIREKAKRLEQDANPCRCDTARSGSEKQGGGQCGTCQSGA